MLSCRKFRELILEVGEVACTGSEHARWQLSSNGWRAAFASGRCQKITVPSAPALTVAHWCGHEGKCVGKCVVQIPKDPGFITVRDRCHFAGRRATGVGGNGLCKNSGSFLAGMHDGARPASYPSVRSPFWSNPMVNPTARSSLSVTNSSAFRELRRRA